MSKTQILHGGVVFEVKYNYTPKEAMVIDYGDGSRYSGEEKTIEIEDILLDANSVINLLSEDVLEAIGDRIQKIENERYE